MVYASRLTGNTECSATAGTDSFNATSVLVQNLARTAKLTFNTDQALVQLQSLERLRVLNWKMLGVLGLIPADGRGVLWRWPMKCTLWIATVLKRYSSPLHISLHILAKQRQKTPRNRCKAHISLNNIRRAGRLRNRQVIGSGPIVGSSPFNCCPTIQVQIVNSSLVSTLRQIAALHCWRHRFDTVFSNFHLE